MSRAGLVAGSWLMGVLDGKSIAALDHVFSIASAYSSASVCCGKVC
jgi:hypothetical protein